MAADAAFSADPSALRQLATPQTWTAGKHLGLDARMAFDGTGWLERAVLTRASAGWYRLDTVEAALAQVLKLKTTDCRHSTLERGLCPAPASGLDVVR